MVFADEEREEVTLKVLTKSADKAMYQAKNSGKKYCKKNRKMKQKAFHWKNPMESLILWNEK